MKIKKLLIAGAILVAAVAGSIAMTALRAPPEKTSEAAKAPLVKTIRAERRNVPVNIKTHGTVTPRTKTSLVSEVSGTVLEVSDELVAGGLFERGEVLLRIDPHDYRVAVKRAQAALASARAQLEQERARAAQARRDWAQVGNGAKPSDLVLRKPYVAEAEANVQSAEADLEKAERDLEKTRIRAPYDGLVRAKEVDVGQYVPVGTTLAKTIAIDYVEVRLPLSESEAAFLDLPDAPVTADKGLSVTLSAEVNGQQRRWQAKVVRTEGVIDEQSRMLHAVARVREPYAGGQDAPPLRVGTFVAAEIEGRRLQDVVVLPRHTLRADDRVMIVDGERRLRLREVRVARAAGDRVYIHDGVADGERVVVTALDTPVDGMVVRLDDGSDEAARVATAADSDTALAEVAR